jgi:hypothetical protein
MTLRDMLGAVKASVGASVGAARAGSRANSEASESSLDGDSGVTAAGSEVGTDVPDLGPLMFLGTDRRGREVAEAVNLHRRAYSRRF